MDKNDAADRRVAELLTSGVGRAYLAGQSVLIAAWWTLLAYLPASRELFAPAAVGGFDWLLWFLPGDVVTMAAGLLAAWRWTAYSGRVGLVVCLIGISVQTLACLTVPARTGGDAGWAGAVLMLAASLGTLACAGLMIAHTGLAAGLFRPAPAACTARELARRTLMQSAVLWPTFLLLLPWVLARVERAAGWTPSDSAASLWTRVTAGVLVFVVAGVVNVATATAMVRHGSGTPLPVCMANGLVIRGPYAYVRNPMCMSALGQGLGIAILIGSPLTAAYVAIGGIVWQVLIRPAEERDLSERFGTDYDDYRAAVRCWWPRLVPYR